MLPPLAEILKADPLFLDSAVDTREASRITGSPAATLETKRVRGGGPPFIKIGARVLYRRRDLLMWLDSHRRISTSDAADESGTKGS